MIPYIIQGTSEKIKRVLQQHGLKVMQKPTRRFGDVKSKIKDKVVDEKETGVVYSIPCKDCDVQYIGQTGRAFLTRKREHISSVRNFKTEKSALAEHSCNLDHRIAWDRASILSKESREQQGKWEKHGRLQKQTAQLPIETEGGFLLLLLLLFSPIRTYRFCQSTMNSDFSCIIYSMNSDFMCIILTSFNSARLISS